MFHPSCMKSTVCIASDMNTMIKAFKAVMQVSFPLSWRWICPMMQGTIRWFYISFCLCTCKYIYTSHFPRFRKSPCKFQGDHPFFAKDSVCFSPKPTAEKHWDHSSVRSSALPAIAQLHKAQSLDLFRRNKLMHRHTFKMKQLQIAAFRKCVNNTFIQLFTFKFSIFPAKNRKKKKNIGCAFFNGSVSKGQKHRHRHCEAIPAPKSRARTLFG